IAYFTDKIHQYFNGGKNEDKEEPEVEKNKIPRTIKANTAVVRRSSRIRNTKK
ncbi:14753_t:CDS:2, partial [Entrophospora sp. SA101]